MLMRSRFEKTKDMVFISHLDLMRLLQRSLRRANIRPLYSQGFNPQPKMAFAQALSLGMESLGEYMDVEIEEDMDIEEYQEKLNSVLPEGVKLIKTIKTDEKVDSLMSLVQLGEYEAILPENIDEEEFNKSMQKLLDMDEIIFMKENKKGQLKEQNIREFVHEALIRDGILYLVLSLGSQGSLKPEVFINKILQEMNLESELEYFEISRIQMYYMDKDKKLNLLGE